MKPILMFSLCVLVSSSLKSQEDYKRMIENVVGLSFKETRLYLVGLLKGKEPVFNVSKSTKNGFVTTLNSPLSHVDYILTDSYYLAGIHFFDANRFQEFRHLITNSSKSIPNSSDSAGNNSTYERTSATGRK